MNQQNILLTKADAVTHALEEYKTACSMSKSMSAVLSPALEGFGVRPGLEEEVVEKRKNVFVRIYDFFKSLFQRIAAWIEKRREKGREMWRAKENKEATEASMDVDPSEVQEAVKKAQDIDVSDLERATNEVINKLAAKKAQQESRERQSDAAMKFMSALVSDAEKLLQDKEFLNTHFAAMAKDYSGYYTLHSGSSNDFLNKIVHLNTTFKTCASRLEHAIGHAKNGRPQAAQLIDQLLEQVSGAIAESREILESFGKVETVEIPSVHAILEAAVDDKLIGVIITQLEDNGHEKIFERIENEMEPLLAVFKEIAESDPSSLSGTATAIQEIGVDRLNTLAQTPVYLMAISGRINTLGTMIIPSSPIDVRKIAQKAISVASNGKNIIAINEAATLSLLSILKNRYK